MVWWRVCWCEFLIPMVFCGKIRLEVRLSAQTQKFRASRLWHSDNSGTPQSVDGRVIIKTLQVTAFLISHERKFSCSVFVKILPASFSHWEKSDSWDDPSLLAHQLVTFKLCEKVKVRFSVRIFSLFSSVFFLAGGGGVLSLTLDSVLFRYWTHVKFIRRIKGWYRSELG
jgi:hypothetical protein